MIPYRQLRKRIEQDKARKHARRSKRAEEHDRLEKVITPRHYIRSIQVCRRGVRFKLSVQKYSAKPFAILEKDYTDMRNGIAPGIFSSRKVVIRERGKERIITPIQMRDRVNHRVLCDYALTPMIYPRLIYDNGASMKGKGVGFARKRFNVMLEKAKRLWGSRFYALTFDFKRFFDNIPHRLCLKELNKTFRDRRITDLTMGFIEGYLLLDAKRAHDADAIRQIRRHTGRGVCLGSHVSQIMALCVPNYLDHFLKDRKRVKFYIRYMDDGIILHSDRAFLRRLLRDMRRLCSGRGMPLNPEKTHIIPIRKGICFLKIRYRLDGMKTVKRLCRGSIIRMRRKLNRFRGLLARGKMTPDMVTCSYMSWVGHTKNAMAHHQRKYMNLLYHDVLYPKGAVT